MSFEQKMSRMTMVILGLGMVFSAICPAQMATFPSPPPLPPPAQSVSDQATNNAPVTAPTPALTPSAPSPSNEAAPTNSAGSVTIPPAPEVSNAVPATAALINSMTALDDKVPLEPGDRISFRVIEDQDAPSSMLVTDLGEVEFPYVGPVKVQGETCYQVAVKLKKILEVDYYKRATVIISLDIVVGQEKPQAPQAPHEVVWLVGQVRQVGPMEISPTEPTTVSQIIMRAGGFGDMADQRKVKIIHRADLTRVSAGLSPEIDSGTPQDAEVVDVKAVFDGRSTLDPVVKPNDYIIVPKRLINF